MNKLCPECGNNLITSYRKISFCDDDISRCMKFPILTYVCKECGFSVTPKSAEDKVHKMIGGL